MISKAADSDVQNMAQAVAENPQWLSKMQVSLLLVRAHLTQPD